MLVLTRKANEQIQIGDDIVITILQVKGQSVRIGIEAPREVRVLRSELSSKDETPAETPALEGRSQLSRVKSRRIPVETRSSILRNSPLLASAAPLATRVEHIRISPAVTSNRLAPNTFDNRVTARGIAVDRPLVAAAIQAAAGWVYDGCEL